MEQNTGTSLFELQIDHFSSGFLKEASRWGKFLSIVGFVGCGFMVLIGLFAGSAISSGFSGTQASGLGYMGAGAVSVVYIAFAVLSFFPWLYLFNFSSRMQAALRGNDQDVLGQAFRSLKSCLRFMGILTIICLGLFLLGMVIAIIGVVSR